MSGRGTKAPLHLTWCALLWSWEARRFTRRVPPRTTDPGAKSRQDWGNIEARLRQDRVRTEAEPYHIILWYNIIHTLQTRRCVAERALRVQTRRNANIELSLLHYIQLRWCAAERTWNANIVLSLLHYIQLRWCAAERTRNATCRQFFSYSSRLCYPSSSSKTWLSPVSWIISTVYLWVLILWSARVAFKVSGYSRSATAQKVRDYLLLSLPTKRSPPSEVKSTTVLGKMSTPRVPYCPIRFSRRNLIKSPESGGLSHFAILMRVKNSPWITMAHPTS